MSVTASHRWIVASRVAAAGLGGYALTSAATVLLALIWPISKGNAVAAASMLSFTIYTIVVIWVFATRTAVRAWIGVGDVTLVLAFASWLLARGAT